MKEKLIKNKTLVIVIAAILVAGIGFIAGMSIKTALASSDSSYIDAEKAKNVALESVGVSSEKATFTKVELEKYENPVVYEIDFYTASHEYDFEIDAKTSEIIEKNSEALNNTEKENETVSSKGKVTKKESDNSADRGDYIGVSKAKNIALKHAGISKSKASFFDAKLDTEDGIRVYEVEFVSGNDEYEYEINAVTGEILKYDKEYMDEYDD